MDMFLLSIQVISALLLIVLITLQTKGKGFGPKSSGGASFTRRGLEKVVFRFTFVLAAIFIIVSILRVAL